MIDDVSEALVRSAQQGDRAALEKVVAGIQDQVFGLSLRMLHNPQDAKEATQEILVLVITKLSTFEFRSRFKTWVYRVACNYLITEKKIRDKDPQLSFDDFRHDLESDLLESEDPKLLADHQVLLNELRVSCTLAMLLCLDQKHRLAYILGEIMELNQQEASEALDVSKDTFRQQLARARAEVLAFTKKACGLVNSNAKCSCPKKLPGTLARGRLQVGQLTFTAARPEAFDDLRQRIGSLDSELRTVRLQQDMPKFGSPENFSLLVRDLLKDAKLTQPRA